STLFPNCVPLARNTFRIATVRMGWRNLSKRCSNSSRCKSNGNNSFNARMQLLSYREVGLACSSSKLGRHLHDTDCGPHLDAHRSVFPVNRHTLPALNPPMHVRQSSYCRQSELSCDDRAVG